jgi:uncharacterized membrane-anchored protein
METQARAAYRKLGIAIGVLALIIGSFLLYNAWPERTGERIVLAIQPVDPFDPLRGQYMIIRYDISSIPLAENIGAGDTIFVTVAPDENGTSRYVSTSAQRPDTGTFLKGTVENVRYNSMEVRYGIEQYFFERNADLNWEPEQTVEVAVTSSGRTRITRLLSNGEPITIEYRNRTLAS